MLDETVLYVKQEEEREENKDEEQEKKGGDAEIQEKVINRFSIVQTFKLTQRTSVRNLLSESHKIGYSRLPRIGPLPRIGTSYDRL